MQFPGDAGISNPKHKKVITIEDVVMEHVLPFLPAKTLCRFKAVCKKWHRWINSPFFAHRQSCYFKNTSGFFYQHPNGYPLFFISMNPHAYGVASPFLSFLPEPVTIRTSCNGLICCQSYSGDDYYYICNPVNQQWQALPKSNLYHGPGSALVLAYEPSIFNFAANYELICAIPSIDEPVVRFEIFSSRSRTWRVVDTICADLNGTELCGDGFYMNGLAYWETLCGEVLAFDMRYELHSVFPLPANWGPGGILTFSHGELCYVLPHRQEKDECMIEVYGGMDMSLKHEISFHLHGGKLMEEYDETEEESFLALPCLSDHIFAVAVGRKLVTYDVRTHKVRPLNVEIVDGGGRFVAYVNSLVHVRHHQIFREIRDVTTRRWLRQRSLFKF